MISVKVDQLFLSNMGFVVLLKSSADERSLPIFIGAAEAQAIALRINGIDAPRPMTHDLMKRILDFLECRLKRVEVCELREGTFYAKLILERDGEEQDMDSRPSDAIALSLRFNAPIYVAEQVMEEAGRVFTGEDTKGDTAEAEAGESKKRLTPLETLKIRLDKVISQEQYEEAAKLRDEIRRIEGETNQN
ncbi:MAG: bifunctional nuclease family protein [Lentisphaerae bacterium]|nr:bifunctional nuclease family protein [Lentisphaerota bacterium]